MWPERNSPNGQSRKLAVLTKKPGGLPERGGSVLHPGTVNLGPTIQKGDPWQENEWQFPILV